ncbi:MAG: porphobilinogen synthase [Bdellovibrionales bacterium]|nr:porphobilinogen synthase [Bdellovibrionales bacterium]
MRRLRSQEWIRNLVAENHIQPSDLIWPLFLIDGNDRVEAVESMPGVFRYTIDRILPQIEQAKNMGISAVALFPLTDPTKKDEKGSESTNPENLICRAVRSIKNNIDGIGVMCDVALDPYTSHGHDGIIKDGVILNDPSVEILCAQALVQAQAGCDILGPSDMMDGRVLAIRNTLEGEGFHNTQIMSYACKYASSFYGPFRDAVGSKASLSGDKKSYQQDPSNGDEALREAALDIQEGADMIMVKPGMPYLDILYRVKKAYGLPTFAYQVSGEYSMIKAAAEKSWIDEKSAMWESILAFKRAGASGVLTYFAMDLAKELQK